MSSQSSTRTRDPQADALRAALEDYAAAQDAWRSAVRAAERAAPGSLAASVTLESARHDLRMARGRVLLEQQRKHGLPPGNEKSWGSH